MSEITHRTLKTNGINVHLAEAGDGPLVLLVHGFPESWYSWRHQIPALAAAGYHAAAVDVRGYGRSDAPELIEAYSMKEMTADMAGIVDALSAKPAVIVGHDWGAPIAWTSAVLYPEHFRAVAGMSVPFLPRAPMPPTQLFKQVFGDTFFYILYFQAPGVAEAELQADVRRSMRLFLYAASGDAPRDAAGWVKQKDAKFLDGMPEPASLPAWLTEQDLDYFTAEFERTGFRGGLNRYRNMDRDWDELPHLAGAKVTQPALFVCGDRDGVIAMNPGGIEAMKPFVPNLRRVVMLPGAGHWTQQERPDEVNAALLDFLKGL
ncbi:MAG TPA: alpha/beta hydrolase [Dehalococcoidia bacterium]|nr:alpha/beta hydrolase [Dehalococcoidia bacterium]